ncbi:uridine kinase [Cellulomonas fimi]|uniref:Phosphoribulokinase / uridine kinase family n=1 Tax=Cellulomonas fimi (strain ATCC 484 / DSM 20113 / JCM 1341 / CCUG 24087 / LMG 16345 / NBRC 15513 / NCIMB 8980 / NCTC 7547 / NRS-133) TaxID=590998 RepID=F4H2L9_CELFA|nr:uridine kinase [Cellulomonas fimi]AEE45245.1 phosphoribulokinase / uridine kinase family [Cellulomonas fimi ATCC 484]NNH07089.1 uridine kinase [Cellulomonas fimi]VEH28691.1 uridine kinase [Cellulomonas fimi]
MPTPIPTPVRASVLAALAARVPPAAGRPVLVGVDGVDGAGKTVLADELATVLRAQGRTVVRASVDGFHRPRAERYARGRSSPEGFYLDSYDLDALRRELLEPFAAGGSRRYRTAVRDVATDRVLDGAPATAPDDAVLLVDGIFLHRPELAPWWDVSVFLDVPFAVTYARMAVRDGCPADPEDPANTRYREGQRRYLRSVDPARRATVVVDNADPAAPVLVRADAVPA